MKPIRIDGYSDIIRKNCMSMIDSALKAPNLSDKFNLSVNLKELIPVMKGGAVVTFSAKAYSKLMYIVHHEDKEVAVHGTIYREPSNDLEIATFFVDDIFVYPQEVTAAFAEATDDYGDWLAHLPDEVFHHLRFQAHSHVLMSVSPSGVDTTFYSKIVADVKDFYVFMILNKRAEVWCEIYDVENNIYYEKQDVIPAVQFSDDPADSSAALNEILKANVTAKVYGNYGYQGKVTPATPSFITEPTAPSKEKKKKGRPKKDPGTTGSSSTIRSETNMGGDSHGVHSKSGKHGQSSDTSGNRTICNPHFGDAIKQYEDKVQKGRTYHV